MIKPLKLITIFFSVCSLILFLIIPFFRWRFTDDFAFSVELGQENLFKMLLDRYLTWDARFLMPFSIMWFAAMKFLHYKVLMFLSSLSLLGISYYIIMLFAGYLKQKLSIYNLIVYTALMNGIVFILIYHVHSDLTYWVTGSAYIHSILIMMIWLNNYVNKKPNTLFFFIFSFIVATLSQNITIGILILVFIDFIFNFNSSQRDYYLKLVLLFLIGIMIATFSPGSFVQFKLMQSASYSSQVVSSSLSDYIIHFFKIYVEALKPNILMFLLLPFIFVSVFNAINFKKAVSIKLDFFTNLDFSWKVIIEIIHRNKFYFASIFALTIYWPTLLYGDRYYIGFYIFLLVGIIFSWISVSSIIKKTNFSIVKVKLVILLVLFVSTLYYSKTLLESVKVYKFLYERENLLENNRGSKSLILPVLNFNEFTRTIRTPEISKNPRFFPNATLSLYYCIDSIYAGDVIEKSELNSK